MKTVILDLANTENIFHENRMEYLLEEWIVVVVVVMAANAWPSTREMYYNVQNCGVGPRKTDIVRFQPDPVQTG